MTALTHSPADIIRQLLVDLGLAIDPTYGPDGQYTGGASWPVFAHSEPSFPDRCITVRETDAQDDGPDMHGNLYYHHGCQLRFRDVDKNSPSAKARAVQTAIFQPENVLQRTVTVGGVSYEVWCVIPGPVLNLGYNLPGDKRTLVTVNILTPIRAL